MMTLTAHEILRFSIHHAKMRVRHVALHHDRVVVSFKDSFPQSNLWELAQREGTCVFTRFPKLYPTGFEGSFGHRFEASVTDEFFSRVVAAHRLAIVSMIHDHIAVLVREAERRSGSDFGSAAVDADRLREFQDMASRLFPEDFPKA
ncbi:MAG: hypothetical protein ABTQ27_05270 [Amaricoccus sp.]|uniref:hypothetical protein n=1 Tax=Amaricoccus sp. TaxID=1872485 RepID=UPI0033151BA0